MNNWKECKLGDVLEFGNGKVRPENEGDFPIYGGNGILGYADEFNYESKTIIIGRVGAYCGSVYYENKPIWVSDNALAAKAKNKNVTKFLYYFLVNLNLNQLAEGSSHPLITQTLLNSIDITITDDENEQKAIADVLSSLDDKIDLLHRQNKTLEAMAETLFRKWFVEEENENWEEKKLSEICEIRNGYAFESETYQEAGIKIIRTKNFINNFIELTDLVFINEELASTLKKFYLKRNEFLIVMVGASLGNYAIVTKDILPALQNQNMWAFSALKTEYQYYLNQALKRIIKDNLHIASGSAREFFQKNTFYDFKIKIPDADFISRFNEFSENNFSKVENNRIQIRTLEKLRDTLLPKLMSGEVRVKTEEQ